LHKAANVTVRAGPLELIKNGILILKLKTDSNGKLHGQFTSWNDAGEMTENGNYVEGLKQGIWTVISKNGDSKIVHYRAGAIVEP
jgi:antitoxin component YwqK of YwqJK toxin-antitoxin module